MCIVLEAIAHAAANGSFHHACYHALHFIRRQRLALPESRCPRQQAFFRFKPHTRTFANTYGFKL